MDHDYRARANWRDGDVRVKLLINSPMEDGSRIDRATGLRIAENRIVEVGCRRNGEDIFRVRVSSSVSHNPFFLFDIADVQYGELLDVYWQTQAYEYTEITLVAQQQYDVRA